MCLFPTQNNLIIVLLKPNPLHQRASNLPTCRYYLVFNNTGSWAPFWTHKSESEFLNFLIFLAALGLHCCTQAFSSGSERGLLFVVVFGLLIVVAFLVAEHGL